MSLSTLIGEKSPLASATSHIMAHFGSTDPVLFVRAFYIGCAGTIFTINALPVLQKRLIHYGARSEPVKDENGKPIAQQPSPSNLLIRAIDLLASWKVPHALFLHFYYAAVAGAFFWPFQLITKGFAFRFLAKLYTQSPHKHASMGGLQVSVVSILFAIQACRRLYESLKLMKPGNSTMNGLGWFLGVFFYTVMPVAVWVEGIPAILAGGSLRAALGDKEAVAKILVGLPLFIFSNIAQHNCHLHLASLKKYSLPTYKWFQHIISPHYTFECLIYLALSHIAAPKGQLFNRSIMTALIFEITNLGITAASTKKWYAQKFGEDSVKGRWRMWPYIY